MVVVVETHTHARVESVINAMDFGLEMWREATVVANPLDMYMYTLRMYIYNVFSMLLLLL